MAELINLNRARKAKAKQTRTLEAAQNRATYGISTKLRDAGKAEQSRQVGVLDAHRRAGATDEPLAEDGPSNANT